MQARTIIVAPIVVLTSIALIGAIIDTGRRSAASRPSSSVSASAADGSTSLEQERQRAILAFAGQCPSATECTGASMATSVRTAAKRIEGWPPDPRFGVARRTLVLELQSGADLMIAQEAGLADGSITLGERGRIVDAIESRRAAADRATRAGKDAGIVDDVQAMELRNSADRAQTAALRALKQG